MDFTVKVSGDDANVIGQALGDLPYKVANPVFERLKAQVHAQEQEVLAAHKAKLERDQRIRELGEAALKAEKDARTAAVAEALEDKPE